MSTPEIVPVGRHRFLKIGAATVLFFATITFFAFWLPKEDHRVRYDKEGRYLPAWSLKNLAYAMHDYHEKHGQLPPAAVYSDDGTPLHSWRVLLLPYLGHEELFRRFKLDEPWDSPNNLPLLAKMPQVYCPVDPLDGNPPLEPSTTLFQVFVGKGTAFEGREGLRLIKDFPRTSYTVLIVEGGKSVPWTRPEDIPFDENQPLPKLGGYFKGRFHVVMADCTASGVPQDVKETTLRAAILRNGDGPLLWRD